MKTLQNKILTFSVFLFIIGIFLTVHESARGQQALPTVPGPDPTLPTVTPGFSWTLIGDTASFSWGGNNAVTLDTPLWAYAGCTIQSATLYLANRPGGSYIWGAGQHQEVVLVVWFSGTGASGNPCPSQAAFSFGLVSNFTAADVGMLAYVNGSTTPGPNNDPANPAPSGVDNQFGVNPWQVVPLYSQLVVWENTMQIAFVNGNFQYSLITGGYWPFTQWGSQPQTWVNCQTVAQLFYSMAFSNFGTYPVLPYGSATDIQNARYAGTQYGAYYYSNNTSDACYNYGSFLSPSWGVSGDAQTACANAAQNYPISDPNLKNNFEDACMSAVDQRCKVNHQ